MSSLPPFFEQTCWCVGLCVLMLVLEKTVRHRNVRSSKEFTLRFPPTEALATIDRLLVDKHGCKLLGRDGTLRLYVRGDRSLDIVASAHDVPWKDVPVLLIFRCQSDKPGHTFARMTFVSWDETPLTMAAVRWFGKMGKRECVDIREEAEHEATRAASPPAAPKTPDLAAAYAALGLEPGAAWTDVQAAYRAVVKNYHPEKLAELKLPAHLAELAAREVNAKVGAFRALKQHYSAQSSRITGMNGRESNQELHTSS